MGIRYSKYALDAAFTNNFLQLPFNTAKFNDSALTGSVGLVYRPDVSWVLSTNFGTAFRSPNVDDIGKTFDSAPGTLTIPNPNIVAEYAYSFDIGATKVFNDKIKFDLSAYYTILDNALVRRNFTLNGKDSIEFNGEMVRIQALQNAAFAEVYGIQCGVEFFINKYIRFSSDLNIQLGKEELEDTSISPSRHTSPTFNTSRLTFTKGKLKLQLYSQYMAERKYESMPLEEIDKTEIYAKDKNGNPYAPSWFTLNFKGMYDIQKKISFTFGIENMTDVRYRPYSSGISAAGLNLVLGINARF
jgi:hemoglobin/transferrin/lactoferrin receptor protein